jgi:hypothetical protein
MHLQSMLILIRHPLDHPNLGGSKRRIEMRVTGDDIVVRVPPAFDPHPITERVDEIVLINYLFSMRAWLKLPSIRRSNTTSLRTASASCSTPSWWAQRPRRC